MSINIWTDSMQHAALLGKPVLFTNWLIQRDIIPDGWYCYDLRGTHKSPSTRTTLVDHAADYHAGTVLSPIPLKHEGTASRRVNGTFYLLGEEMTLEQFCEEHDLAYPQDNREFVLRPASLDEVGLFYSEEKLDEALGTVGHLRMDFGHGEKEFWHTWWPHNEDRFNTPEFKEVLQRFVDDLRQTGLLKNLGAMDAYCWQHGGSITEDRRSYGYIAETENYRFCLRCTPFPGEYQGYLYCYDLCQQEMYRQEHPVVGRVTFASGEQQEFTDSKALLQAIREELPFRSTTGFRFETLTDDPEVKKAVDDILLDFAGEDNSRRTCNYGLTETGKQALKRGRLKNTLAAAGLNMTPEEYTAFAMVKTGAVLLTVIPCLLIFPMLALIVVLLAVAVYFKEIRRAEEKLSAKRDEIEAELPRFVATITQELAASRDVLSMIEHYKQNSGPVFSAELDVLTADMRSGSYEAALTRFEARFNSPLLSDIVRGLIGVLRGDNGVHYFQMLSHDMKQLELQRLKAKAMKIPPKIRVFSFVLLMCFLVTYLSIIIYEIIHSLGGMF